jgi:ATP-dependent Lon protease
MVTAIVSVMTGIPVRHGRGDDGRGHAERPRSADRRPQGEAAGGASRRHQEGADPEENAKDLADIPDNVKNGMEIIPVSRVGEVLRHALQRMPEPIEWVEPEDAPVKRDGADDTAIGVAH